MADERKRKRQTGDIAEVPARRRAGTVLLMAAALVLLTLIAFWPILSSGFVNVDDEQYVTKNAHVLKGLTGESVGWAFTSTEAYNWHPVSWLSHMLDVSLFGLDPHRHHLTSLLIHTTNVILLFLLLAWMTEALWPSAFVAALFAIHSLHVESVAWVAERKDLLSTLFLLLTLLAWMKFLRGREGRWYAAALSCFALGLMSKPMLVTLPFTLLLFDLWPLARVSPSVESIRKSAKGLLFEKAPFFALSAASCMVTFVAQRSGGAVQTLSRLPLPARMATAAVAYMSYIGSMLWPAGLAVFYPRPHAGFSAALVVFAFLVLAAITALALALVKQAPYVTVGWLWYLGTLVPVIGLVQVGEQARADRYTYVPLVGLFIAIAWGLAAIVNNWPALKMPVVGCCAAVLIVLVPVTRAQTRVWANSNRLFEHALAVTQESSMAHLNLGAALMAEGRAQEAIAHYTESARIEPRFADVHENLGDAYGLTGNLDKAVHEYGEALRLDPRDEKALYRLGTALLKSDRMPEAAECFKKTVDRHPDWADAHNYLGFALAGMGQRDEAIEHYKLAISIQPDYAGAFSNLGVALAESKRLPEAIEAFKQVLRLRPDDEEAQANLRSAQAELPGHH